MKTNGSKKNGKTDEQALIARSPEAFPELMIYPAGWDLYEMQDDRRNGKLAEVQAKMATFPKTTDSIL